MIWWLPTAIYPYFGQDPAPNLVRTKTQSAQLECELIGLEEGVRRFPGRVRPERPRGDYVNRRIVTCRERILARDARPALDDAILSTLESRVTELAATAAAVRPDLAERIWLVEAFFPTVTTAEKIDFATKNALMRQGLAVSDRAPVLGFGDVDVITRLAPDRAYPAACLRWRETGSLGEGDTLLAVVLRDPRSTRLHGGICDRGGWTWLR